MPSQASTPGISGAASTHPQVCRVDTRRLRTPSTWTSDGRWHRHNDDVISKNASTERQKPKKSSFASLGLLLSFFVVCLASLGHFQEAITVDDRLFTITFSLGSFSLSSTNMGEEFVWALKNGDLEQVKQLASGTDLNAELMNGRMALHFAADYGHGDIIEYLLKQGAAVDRPDKHGITPLLAAIWEGHVDAARALLRGGADKAGKSPDGQSYLDCAESDEMRALLK